MKPFFIGLLFCIFILILFIYGGEKFEVYQKPANFYNTIDTSTPEAKAFFESAKKQIATVTSYDFSNGYYGKGGFPPDNTGVCSDIIWRSYRNIGKNFKSQILQHQKKHPELYSNFGDSNIAFRRVANINIFLKNTTQNLTTKILPKDKENLSQWQTGDIVIFARNKKGLMHIGIITNIRNNDGVPYMIDNHGYGTDIRITPLDWKTAIIGHYRVFLGKDI